MSYKINGTEIVDDSANGVFTTVYYERLNNTNYNQGATSKVYTMGGYPSSPTPAANRINDVRRYDFINDTNSVIGDLFNLSVQRSSGYGHVASDTHGWKSGGDTASPVAPTATDSIESFPFASPWSQTTDVGNLTQARFHHMTAGSPTYGYSMGGVTANPTTSYFNIIDRWPFSAPFTTASDVGDLSALTGYGSGLASDTYGYAAFGVASDGSTYQNIIEKFPFASSTTGTTDVGDQATNTVWGFGASAYEYGYIGGGSTNPSSTETSDLQRFPFAVDINTSVIGSLSTSVQTCGGSADPYNIYRLMGYNVGGTPIAPSVIWSAVINKFPIASETDRTSIGSGVELGQFTTTQS